MLRDAGESNELVRRCQAYIAARPPDALRIFIDALHNTHNEAARVLGECAVLLSPLQHSNTDHRTAAPASTRVHSLCLALVTQLQEAGGLHDTVEQYLPATLRLAGGRGGSGAGKGTPLSPLTLSTVDTAHADGSDRATAAGPSTAAMNSVGEWTAGPAESVRVALDLRETYLLLTKAHIMCAAALVQMGAGTPGEAVTTTTTANSIKAVCSLMDQQEPRPTEMGNGSGGGGDRVASLMAAALMGAGANSGADSYADVAAAFKKATESCKMRCRMESRVVAFSSATLQSGVEEAEVDVLEAVVRTFDLLQGSRNELLLALLQLQNRRYTEATRRSNKAVQVLTEMCVRGGDWHTGASDTALEQLIVSLFTAATAMRAEADATSSTAAASGPARRAPQTERELVPDVLREKSTELLQKAYLLSVELLGPTHKRAVAMIVEALGPEHVPEMPRDAATTTTVTTSVALPTLPLRQLSQPLLPPRLPQRRSTSGSAHAEGVTGAPCNTGPPSLTPMPPPLCLPLGSATNTAHSAKPPHHLTELAVSQQQQSWSPPRPPPPPLPGAPAALPPSSFGATWTPEAHAVTRTVPSFRTLSAGGTSPPPTTTFTPHAAVTPPSKVPAAPRTSAPWTPRGGSVAAVRMCHRLKHPEDAFLLKGPVQDAVFTDPKEEARKRDEEEAAAEKRRARRARSFLPEDIMAREQRKMEKALRKERRERHERKKTEALRQQRAELLAAGEGTTQHGKETRDGTAARPSTTAPSHHSDGKPSSNGKGRPGTTKSEEGGGRGEAVTNPAASSDSTAVCHPTTDMNGNKSCDDGNKAPSTLDAPPGDLGSVDGNGEGADATHSPSLHDTTRDHSEEGTEGHSRHHRHGGRRVVAAPHRSNNASPGSSSRGGSRAELSESNLPTSLSTLSASIPPSIPSSDEESDAQYVESVEECRERRDREMLFHFTHMHTRRHNAACVIQRAWRSCCARLELHNRRQLLYKHVYMRQKAAALCVTGFLKSTLARKRRTAAVAGAHVADMQRAEQERLQLRSARVIASVAKRWLAQKHKREHLRALLNLHRDERLQQYEVAAVLVQRWWALAPVRKAYWLRRTAEVAEERRQREEQAKLDAAATTIQSVVRGVLERRAVRVYKAQRAQQIRDHHAKLGQSTDLVAFVFREYMLRCQRLTRQARDEQLRADEAARLIQGGWAAALHRRCFDRALTIARALRLAASTIQRGWRRYYAGRELRYLRHTARTVQEDRQRTEFQCYGATLTLQSFARVVLAKRTARGLRAAGGRAIILALFHIQAVGRGAAARRSFGEQWESIRRRERLAAAEAQAHRERCVAIVDAFLHARASEHEAESRRVHILTEKLFMRRLVRQELRRDAAASKVQRAERRRQARAREREADAEAERARRYVYMCVLRVQCAWRVHAAKCERARQQRLVRELAAWRQDLEEVEAAAAAMQGAERVAALELEIYHERTQMVAQEAEERECYGWWYRHESKKLFGFIKDDDDDEAPPESLTAVLRRAMMTDPAENDGYGSIYD